MAVYKVQAPNGRIIQIEGPEGATDDQLIAVAQQEFQKAPQRAAGAQAQIRSDAITQSALNPAEGMSGFDQFRAGMGKTFTDLGQGAAQMLGLGPSRAEVDERRDRDVSLMATPGGFSGSIAGGAAAAAPAAVLGPSLAAAGGTGALYGALQPVGQEDSRLMNTAIGGLTAGGMKFGLDKLASGFGGMIQNMREANAPANARAAELAKILAEGRKAGMRVPPSQANPSTVNRLLESLGGKAATQQQASTANQNVLYGAAQRHAGLPPNQAMTEASLEAARRTAAAPYQQVAATSSKAARLLETWKKANFDARMQHNFFAKSGNPDAYKAAQAAQQKAEAALDGIEKVAGPALRESLQAARQQIAKIHTAENIMRGASVDAGALLREVNRNVPVSGELKQMAQFAANFPKAVQSPQSVGSPAVNQLLPTVGGGVGAMLGGSVGGIPGGSAGAMLGYAATQAIPPMARSLILSRPYQALMTTPQAVNPGMSLSLINSLLQNPQARAMLPAAAAGYATSK